MQQAVPTANLPPPGIAISEIDPWRIGARNCHSYTQPISYGRLRSYGAALAGDGVECCCIKSRPQHYKAH